MNTHQALKIILLAGLMTASTGMSMARGQQVSSDAALRVVGPKGRSVLVADERTKEFLEQAFEIGFLFPDPNVPGALNFDLRTMISDDARTLLLEYFPSGVLDIDNISIEEGSIIYRLPRFVEHGNGKAAQDLDSQLINAAIDGQVEKVKGLLDAGADAKAKDTDDVTALMLAASQDHTETVIVLLEAGADVEAKNINGGTALILVAKEGHTETAKALLEAGADVEAKNEDGLSALIAAAGHGRTETTKALLEAGADLEPKGPGGATALMAAAMEGYAETAKVLLEAGANVEAKGTGGATARTLAASGGHTEIVELLEKAGASATPATREALFTLPDGTNLKLRVSMGPNGTTFTAEIPTETVNEGALIRRLAMVRSLQEPDGGIPDLGVVRKLELDYPSRELVFVSFEFTFELYTDMVDYLQEIRMDPERVGKFVTGLLNVGIENPHRVLIELDFRGIGDDAKPVILDEPVLRIPAVGFDSSKVR